MINIIQAIEDKNLFGPWFKNTETWQAWRAFLAALFGLPLDHTERRIFRECTRRQRQPKGQVSEAWMVVGRRGGKSFISALVAVFLACFGNYEQYLAPGETGVVMLIATDRKQARILVRYISALLNNVALLKPMISKETLETVELTNRVTIEVHTCSFRTVRGYTVIACIGDEIAFWRQEDTANPDREVLDAVRPGMATIPNSLLLCLSSPYAKRGELFNAYKRHFSKERDDLLIWQAPTRTMNPSVPQSVIDQAIERDPESAKAEYLAQFRSDIESYISREAVESCVVPSRIELAPVPGVRYRAFTDPSGGSADSFTLAICHEENGRKVLDCVREIKPRFNPDTVVVDFSNLLRSYWLQEVTGDRYAGAWVSSKFREHGITYKVSEKVKSDLYKELLPLLNSGSVELLEHKRLFSQLTSLERRTGRGGRDTIDHPTHSHDDVANAVAGVLVGTTAAKKAGTWGNSTTRRHLTGSRFGTI